MSSMLITDISKKDLPSVVTGLDFKAYTAAQIISWLYAKRVSSFDEMTNLTKGMRETLKSKFEICALNAVRELSASDGTRKYLLQARDLNAVECVFIPAEDERNTICISTQMGCAMGCAVCRTAGMGFVRDLTQGEILGQLIHVLTARKEAITNIVLMGMGEPLANLDAVSNAVELMLDMNAFGFSKRRLTLSTCGLLPELEKFTDRFEIKIAISLNATTDEIREKLMPINRRYKISDIMEFCRAYSKRSRYRITFEYVLIAGVNDTEADSKRLVKLLSGIRAKVNVIPLNPFDGCGYKTPKEDVVERFGDDLRAHGAQVNIRKSRGGRIMAACGQLATMT